MPDFSCVAPLERRWQPSHLVAQWAGIVLPGSERDHLVSYTAKGATFVSNKPRLWSDHRIFSGIREVKYPDGTKAITLPPSLCL
jgi:hypothetical protein